VPRLLSAPLSDGRTADRDDAGDWCARLSAASASRFNRSALAFRAASLSCSKFIPHLVLPASGRYWKTIGSYPIFFQFFQFFQSVFQPTKRTSENSADDAKNRTAQLSMIFARKNGRSGRI
jgi:hypothetical protein